jgi:hypothetical protein
MAKPEIQELYQRLMNDRFRFLGRGEHDLHDIYGAVKNRYRDLCDDSYLCRDNCSSGHDQPEWQHTVRKSSTP